MKSTITIEQQQNIKHVVDKMHLAKGMGTKENACSIAAINLALTGKLTDDIPECMSYILGRWIIKMQDIMPDSVRNSVEWKDLLPLAAGTGRAKEDKIAKALLDHIWTIVLPYIQPLADKQGYGKEWLHMTTVKTKKAANAYAYASAASAYAYASAAKAASAYAACANAAAACAAASAYAACADAYAHFWQHINMTALLAKLINICQQDD